MPFTEGYELEIVPRFLDQYHKVTMSINVTNAEYQSFKMTPFIIFHYLLPVLGAVVSIYIAQCTEVKAL